MRIRGATLITMDDPAAVIAGGELVIDEGRLTYVGPADGAPATAEGEEVLDADGLVAIPGLIQSHVHTCQSLFRNHADDLALLDWLRLRIWPFEGAHDPASLRASADLGYAELLRGGTTACLDMATVQHTDVVFEAARDAGIRATVGKCHMDVDAGQPANLRESTRASLEEAITLCDRWHGAEGGRLRYGFAPRFVLSCTEDLFRGIAHAARERGARIHTHASENRDECRIVRERTGRDNVDYFLSIGLGGEDLVLAHCVHLDEREISGMARHGVKVAHCPSSNLKLGSGIARIPELVDRGISVSIGADGAPCNNNLDALVEMRLAALLQKPRLGPEAMPAEQVLRMATVEGAKALGLEDEIGRLRVGMQADVTLLELRDLATEPGGNVYARIVYAAQSRHVRHVVVGGRVVVQSGELLTVDEERVRARAVEERAQVETRLG